MDTPPNHGTTVARNREGTASHQTSAMNQQRGFRSEATLSSGPPRFIPGWSWLERRTFYASDAFEAAIVGLGEHVAHASPFAVSGVYTYVRDGKLTLAGLRGSRPTQLIERIGALNQVGEDVRHLLFSGAMPEPR